MLNDKRLIFIVRHGRTALNVQQVFRGRLDGPLDDVGVRQSEQTGELLQDIDLGTIYTSPLERSVQTAAIVSVRTFSALFRRPVSRMNKSTGDFVLASMLGYQRILKRQIT